jgi:tetratricopeptide (TPR) repeat protein
MSKPNNSPDEKVPQARWRISAPFALPWSVPAGVVLIAAAVFLAYLPSINGGFIWDDHDLITNNNLIKASDGPLRIWCTTEPIDYWPATNTSFWIEWRLWEMNSAGYHVTNLILHIVESVLIWIILRKLSMPGAFLAAMIFALHPVNVESVAWIAQRKNLMAMLFFLISILWYLRFIELARRPTFGWYPFAAKQSTVRCPMSTAHCYTWYWLSLAAFALAMLSKGSVAVLPILLLGIVWWLRPLTWRDLVWTAPFFLVALVFTVVNMWFQTFGMEEAIRSAGYAERLLGAGCVVWFYLYKAILPINLSFVYAHWHIETDNPLLWLPLAAALVVTAVLWRYRKSWSRTLLFAWGFFCAVLVPVMGFTDVYFMRYALVADHYQHIAIIAVIALASALWSAWDRLELGSMRWTATATAVAALGILALLTWQQSGQYRDEFTLYEDTLKKSPDCWMAHTNLGKVLVDAGRLQEAMDHLQQALRIKSDNVSAYNDLGNVLVQMGRVQEAMEYYRKALSIKPDYPQALNNLGNALVEAGRPEEAIEYCQKALRLDPGFHEAYFNLGNAFLYMGRSQEAIDYYHQALTIKSDYAEAHNNLANALIQAGRPEEAIEHCQTALRLKPGFAEAHFNLGNAFLSLDRLPEAIEHYRQALALKPGFAQAHNNLGGSLVKAGRPGEAIEYFQQALRLRPQFTDAYYNLALAYAGVHQSSEAVAAAGKALELARSQGQTALARQIEDWLNSYSAGQPDSRKTPTAPEGHSKPP